MVEELLVETVQILALLYMVHYVALWLTRSSRAPRIAYPRQFLPALLAAPAALAAAEQSHINPVLLLVATCALLLLQGEGFAFGRTRARFLPGRRRQRIHALRSTWIALAAVGLAAGLSEPWRQDLLLVGRPLHTSLSWGFLRFPLHAMGLILLAYHLAPALLHRLALADRRKARCDVTS